MDYSIEKIGIWAKTISLSLVLSVITATGVVIMSYYCFFHREIIREHRHKRAVKKGLKGFTRSPSMDNLGLNILFEDLQNKLGTEGLEESVEDEGNEAGSMEDYESTGLATGGPGSMTNSPGAGSSDSGLESILRRSDGLSSAGSLSSSVTSAAGVAGAVEAEDDSDPGPDLPLDMLAFLKSIKVFGYFEEPVFASLYKHSETMQVKRGDYLFKRGDVDCSLYVVVKGTVSIFVSPGTSSGLVSAHEQLRKAAAASRRRRSSTNRPGDLASLLAKSSSSIAVEAGDSAVPLPGQPNNGDGTDEADSADDVDEESDGLLIAEMHDGESVTSLINAVSVMLYGDEYKQRVPSTGSEVTARARTDATLVRIPASAFLQLAQQFPKVCLHMIQVIVTRFHRVTFLTLNRFLGLTDEFLQVEALTHAVATTSSSTAAAADAAAELASSGAAGAEGPRVGSIEMELLCAFTRLGPAEVGTLFSDPRLDYASDNSGDDLAGDDVGGGGTASNSNNNDDSGSSSANGRRTTGPGSKLALVGEMEIAYVQAGERLIQEGEKDAGMFFVLKGELSVTMRSVDSSNKSKQFRTGRKPTAAAAAAAAATGSGSSDSDDFVFPCSPGSMTGYLSLLTHYPSIVDVHAATDATVGYISPETFDRRVLEKDGLSIVKLIARHLVESMSPLARMIDFALDWVHIQAGHVLYREGDESESLYIVLSGRLRSAVTRSNGKVENAGEFGQGDSVGEFDVFTDVPRASNVYAIRDSELVRMPKALMKMLALKIPSVAVQISRLTAQQSIQQLYRLRHPEPPVLDVRTVALLPVTPDVPLAEFAERLTNALCVIGPTLCLTRHHAAEALGKNYFTKMGNLRIASWLEAQEENHRTVVYAADAVPSVWTHRCIRQADLILLVGLAAHPQPMLSQMERALQRMKTAARKELVLVYDESTGSGGGAGGGGGGTGDGGSGPAASGDGSGGSGTADQGMAAGLFANLGGGSPFFGRRATSPTPTPRGTGTWLQERPWITATHHIRLREEDSVGDQTAAQSISAVSSAMRSSPSYDSLQSFAAASAAAAAAAAAGSPPSSPGSGGNSTGISASGRVASRSWLRSRTHSLTSPSRRPAVLGTGLSERASVPSAYSRRPGGDPAAVYRQSDFARLARRLTGKSVGLVLGGGGARGLAHLGVIRALEDAGVPIDVIGGTSMGALVGGLYARDTDSLAVTSFLRRFAAMMMGRLTLLMDLTYPITSIFTGRAFNRIIRKTVGEDVQIEDLWIPYVCVTTNLTLSRMETHRYGSAWRYIRASMTLTGYLPPLSDKGMLLVDGGYMNQLPADVVRTLGADKIIAVDVSSEEDTNPVSYGDTVSGWGLLLSKLNPFASAQRIPTMNEIQERLAFVSSVRQLEEVKSMDNLLYLRPPVSGYKTLEWSSMTDVVEHGYRYAQPIAKNYMKNVLLKDD